MTTKDLISILKSSFSKTFLPAVVLAVPLTAIDLIWKFRHYL